MKNQRGFTLYELIVIVVLVGGLIGWIWNIVKFVDLCCSTITPWFVMRLVGIFAVPFGAIIGWIG